MDSLKKVLMNRDELTSDEADEVIADMRLQVYGGETADNVLRDMGLEPDYIFDLV